MRPGARVWVVARRELRQVGDFVVHLRWHYQLAVVPGVYLLGGLYQPALDLTSFVGQFLNVHCLLLGGATAYNSVWDRDAGPVGGLRQPPPLPPWTHPASLGLQVAGALAGALAGPRFVAVYVGSAVLFWLYSSPHARWKGDPHKSLAVVGLANGLGMVLLGYLAAGPAPVSATVVVGGLGAGLVLVGLYPASQVYQMAEDAGRGDRTFAVRYGLTGIRLAFLGCYLPGVVLLAGSLAVDRGSLGGGLLIPAAIAGGVAWRALVGLEGSGGDYDTVTRLKYVTSGLFVAFIVAALVAVHN